jgi:hypothetical protein
MDNKLNRYGSDGVGCGHGCGHGWGNGDDGDE